MGNDHLASPRLADAFRPIAEPHDTTVAAAAVAQTLAWPGVTGAIIGARSAEQVDGRLDATSLTLTDEDPGEIATAIELGAPGAAPAGRRRA